MSVIRPQQGFQEDFLSTSADIAIGGAAAGVGKTHALLMEPLRHCNNPKFGAVIFRRTSPMIKSEGGLWDKSMTLYPHVGANPKESSLTWVYPTGMKLKFSHLEYDKDVLNWQGSEVPLIGFDELCQFTKYQFFYMLSRNRSTCGVKPYVRATCNPDPDSWVAEFIDWFIGEDGFPIPERCGQLRYFIIQNDNYVWGNTKKEVIDQVPEILKIAEENKIKVDDLIKSMTFIPGSIYQNQELLKVNPQYLSNLLAQDEVTKAQLLAGNWKVRNDGLGLMTYSAVNDIFSNTYVDGQGLKCITCDAARFGKDFMVIRVWNGYKCIMIIVEYKTEARDIVNIIEEMRAKYKIQKSNVLVDQDGVGDGVVKIGGYQGFHGGALPLKVNGIRENYKNLKTQCAYRYADLVNNGLVYEEINNETVRVAGVLGTKVKYGSKIYDIRDLIKQDYRAFKKENPDGEGKKQMNTKEDQKILLNGRSPDFGDSGYMRVWFELRVPEYGIGSVKANA